MRLLRVFLLVLPLLVVPAAKTGAHHAFSPVYDAKRTITVDGVVTQFRFVNPHAMMLMEVKNKAGKVETWNVEFAGRLNLEEAGWNAQHSDQLRVVERFTRSDDGDTLMLTATIEDPWSLREPVVAKKIWRWAPDQKITPYDACEPATEFKKGTSEP